MKPVLLIDTYAQIYRSYYAIRELKTADGQPINALFGMAKFLLKINAEFGGYDGAFVADLGKPTHRIALAPDYKANRPPTPPELKAQLPAIFNLIRAFGWQIHAHETWEADDLLSAFTHAFPQRRFFILSKDKDLAQLVNDRVSMLVPGHDPRGFELRDAAKTEQKFGVRPDQIPDYLCLLGDSADNIPGITGIGEKTAVRLLRQYGSLEGILEHLNDIKGEALREHLGNGRERLAVNRQLVILLRELPLEFSRTDALFDRRNPDYPRILEIARAYSMQSVVSEIRKMTAAAEVESPRDEDDLFSFRWKKDPDEISKSEQDEKGLFQPELF